MPCRADIETETSPVYTDNYGASRVMSVGAEVDKPADGSQFWAVAGVADTCYGVVEQGNWAWNAYSSDGVSDDYQLTGEADSYYSNGPHYRDVGSYEVEYPMPEGGATMSDWSESYWNTHDYLGSNQQQYGGISYYLYAQTGMYDDTYYPGFSALVGALNGFNCACTCP